MQTVCIQMKYRNCSERLDRKKKLIAPNQLVFSLEHIFRIFLVRVLPSLSSFAKMMEQVSFYQLSKKSKPVLGSSCRAKNYPSLASNLAKWRGGERGFQICLKRALLMTPTARRLIKRV